jgi:hypothetical protein
MRIACIIAGLAASCLWTGRAMADVTFRIHDQLATDEIAEVTTVVVDGQTIRSFRLDSDERTIDISVTVPDAGTHQYGFCGHLLIREADGHIVKKPFDITGEISDVADRDFEAVASDDFTRVYIVDRTLGRPPATIRPGLARACVPAVS